MLLLSLFLLLPLCHRQHEMVALSEKTKAVLASRVIGVMATFAYSLLMIPKQQGRTETAGTGVINERTVEVRYVAMRGRGMEEDHGHSRVIIFQKFSKMGHHKRKIQHSFWDTQISVSTFMHISLSAPD